MAGVVDIYRLTPLQEAMLLSAMLDPGGPAYVEQLRIWLDEAPAEDAFRAAWGALVERHAILRTSFHHRGLAQPQQVVHTEAVLPWRAVMLTETGAAAEAGVDAISQAERTDGFDLRKPPLFRLVLVRIGDGRACLIWTFHHLILDGWSLGRVLTEIDGHYRATQAGGRPQPVSPPRPFRDFVRWLAARDADAAIAWWRNRLAGAPAQTGIPAPPGNAPGECRQLLDAETTRRIEASCRRRGTTLATLVRLAWAACLAERDGLRNLCFGTMVSGRPSDLPGVEDMLGLFVNTVMTWVRFAPGECLGALLARLQDEALRERQWDWIALGEVLRASNLKPPSSMVVVETYPLDASILRDSLLRVSRIEVREQADIPLVVAVVPGVELELRLAAAPGGIDAAALPALGGRLAHWLGLLATVDDGIPFDDLLGEGERRTQAALRTEIRRECEIAPTLAKSIFSHGGAIVDASGRWSGIELLARIEALAAEAYAMPPGPIALVGDTDAETVARMLSCVRAGRCYVPLDRADPRTEERRAFVGAVPFDPKPTDRKAKTQPPPWPESDCDAYWLFTSGSTGGPKAVRQCHSGVLAHAARFATAIGLRRDDRLCATASFAYDAAAMDIFATAITGAELRLASPARIGLERLRREMLADATILHTTPSLFRLLASEPLGAELRLVVLGGEAARPSDIALFTSASPEGCVLINGFGPSESTTATQWFVRRGAAGATVPIGMPVDGTRILLLGEDGGQALETAWAEGEIVIESDAVALGYLGAERDNARFSAQDGLRRYRTGDRARRRPSGALDYLGRLDDQVQLNGVRVEPAEVAQTIARLPGVTAAEVLAFGKGDTMWLEAWATPVTLDPDGLKDALSTRLPRGMIPARFHLLGQLPLLANGKIDRAALREAATSAASDAAKPSVSGMASSRAALTDTIMAVFAEVLGRAVGEGDDFFAIGGHSLDALRSCGRIERATGRSIPLQWLFDHPTAIRLAQALQTAEITEPAAAPIPRAPRRWSGGSRDLTGRSGSPLVSLFFFAGDASDPDAGYQLMQEAAIRADALGLHALWLPERHFDGFGGLYPNPSVLAAHLAARTNRIALRAGSVVLPLRDPFRVAEEWSVVDRLSGGRVGIAVASGWHRQDFSVLSPGNYDRRKEILFEKLAVLMRLWRGEAVFVNDPELGEIAISTWPRPIRSDLELWLTCQSPESFREAGARGLHLLTNLNYKSLDDLAERVALYRQAGESGAGGRVTVMTHTLVAGDDAVGRRHAADAYMRYIKANLALQQSHARGEDRSLNPNGTDIDALAANAAHRLLEHGSLIGSVERCRARLNDLRNAGADEVACLIDFGVDPQRALEGVERLADLVGATPSAGPVPVSTLLPAAPLQEQLWVLEALSETPGQWMIPTLVRLDGPLDPALLEARLAALVRRHEALRTCLVEDGGVVKQRVYRDLGVALERHEAASEADAAITARALLEQGVRLNTAPLVRAALFRVASDVHVLLFACHHAIADGSSTVILARELLEGPSDSIPLQAGDWSAWQAARLAEGALDSQLRWWDAQLENLPARLRLGDGLANRRRGSIGLALDDRRIDACRSTCFERQCTMFELLLTAYVAMLGRVCGASDLLVGLHHTNRAHPDLEGVVGPLVNLLPLRVREACSGDIERVRDIARAALARHEVPYATLAARHGRRDGVGDPLLDAVILHQNLPKISQGILRWSRIEFEDGATRFPLTLVLRETGDQLDGRFEYDTGLFSEAAAADLAHAFLRSLDALLGGGGLVRESQVAPDPAIRLPGAHLLAPFVAETQRDPNAVAIRDPDGAMTRGELLLAARRLAAAIRARAEAGARIGVMVPPSIAMIVAVYGVLLADCTLIPLDPRDPPARRATETHLAKLACVVTGAPIQGPTLSPIQSGDPLPMTLSGAHPAYIIFTSGSTGIPKGVVVGHDSVRALIGWARRTYNADELRAALLTAPIRFDMSVFGLYVPLAGPGGIVVIPDLASLVDTPPPCPVSLVYTVPSALRALFAAGVALPAGVKTVNLGGEALDADLVARSLEGAERVCNMYGPTESTSNAFFEEYRQPAEPTIGRPITGTGAWIRKADGSCAALGEIGELVLTGAGLALGYLNAPDNHAFTAQGYRTGDRASMTPDGRFVYYGRADAQVKVRGYRLELGEVEASLVGLTGVLAAASRVRNGDLEALIVTDPAVAVPVAAAPGQIRGWMAALAERLPAHAIPSRWISVPCLPLMANGKLDRAAVDRIAPCATIAPAPMADRSAIIADCWEEILGVRPPNETTSFFELGGHSLLAIKLRRRLEDRLGEQVSLRTVLEHPTIAGLLLAFDGTPPAANPMVLEPAPEARHEPFPLTPLQQAYWVGSRDDLALGGVSTQCFLELETHVPLDRLEQALATLIRRHAMLRAVIDADGRQRILANPGPFPFPIEDMSDVDDPRPRLAALRTERSHYRCDPGVWPMLRVWGIRLEDRVILHLSLPALQLDAHSAYLLAHELEALLRGEALAEPGPDFRDAVLARLRVDPGGEGRTDLPPGPQLPFARDPDSITATRFRRLQLRLPAERWAALRAAASRLGLTPAGAVLSAFAWTLSAWAEQSAFSLVVTYFDRPPLHPHIDRVVGDFTSARLVPVESAGDLASFCRRVQSSLWTALDDPKHDSVRCIRTLRRSGQTPAFGVVFTSTLGIAQAARDGLGTVTYALTQTSQVWLDHKLREQEGMLVSTWDLIDGLFPSGMPEAMLESFEAALNAMADADWDQAGPSLPAKQAQARTAYNATAWSPDLPLLHDGLFRQADDRLAVVCGEDRISRRRLANAAATVARRLLEAGLTVGDIVAVPARHGWRQAAACLGVMAAGGAWTPIDPDWPALRAERVLKTSGARLALGWTGVELPGDLPAIAVESADLDTDSSLSVRDIKPESLAYVIFTSGSTGVPKGVAVPHAGAANTLTDLIDRFGLKGERILGLANLNFDLSVFDVFGAFLCGGAVVHPERGDERDPQAWAALIRREAVTVWDSVPALALMLVEHLEARGEQLPSLRLALLSGDWIPLDLAPRLRAVAPNCQVIGLGGATEGSIWSIAHPIKAIAADWKSIPYGRPLRGQGMHVLDDRRRPRPDWAIGEIHISGRGVAHGYHGDEAATARSFWRHPVTGEAMYATGDLGRFRPEGWIEFLGRRDGQVKVRGHRIELGDIEAALLEHPAVRQAVAAAPRTASGQRQLLAYVATDLGEAALRAHLADRLPSGLLPQRIISMAALPLSENGKIDRGALAKILDCEPTLAPDRDDTPAVLALLRDVLQRPDAGADDDFFTLGGDSVIAVRLLTRIERDFGRRLPIRDLFSRPTARQLAQLIDGGAAKTLRAVQAAESRPASIDAVERAAAKARRGRRIFNGAPQWEVATALPPPARESTRFFAPFPLPPNAVAGLAASLCTGADGRRRHPSTGGAYGVQSYMLFAPDRVDGRNGSWWLDADAGRLLKIGDQGWNPAMGDRPPNTQLARDAAFALLFVADLDTLEPLYGSDALRLATLEAGYMGQLAASEAPSLDLGLCPIGNVDEERVSAALKLEPRHRIVHALFGGRPLESLIRDDARWSGDIAKRGMGVAGAVLLTGATGRLGGALLEALLADGHEVVCAIRGDAERRLQQLLERHRLGLRAGRIRVVEADLARGLDIKALPPIGTVVHAAGDVNFVKDYAALRGVNVLGTRAILDLCAGGAVLHHVSSLSIFREAGRTDRTEDEPPPPAPPRRGGYAQTKWAAEQMVRAFIAAGGQAHIHRLALVTSAGQTADDNPDDYLAALRRGCQAVGTWPDVDVDLPLVRLDTAARAITATIGTEPRTWHLQEPVRVTMRQLADQIGGLEAQSPEQWLRRVEAAVAADADHPLAASIEVLRNAQIGGALDPNGPNGSRLDGTRSWQILAGLGVRPTDDPNEILSLFA